MENTKMNFFQRIFKSISSPKEYFKLTRISGGRLTGFVFLFVLLTTIIGTIMPLYIQITSPVSSLNKWLNTIPEFELRNGELIIERTYEFNEDGVYLLVDTSNDFFSSEDFYAKGLDKRYTSVFLIGRYNMIVSNGLNQVQEIVYSKDFPGVSFSNRSIIKTIKPFVLTFAPIIIYIVYLIGYFLFALLYSLFGLIVSALSNTKLPFGLIFKSAVFGKVIMVCIKTIFDCITGIAGIPVSGSLNDVINLAGIVVTCIYITYGILSHKSQEAIEMYNRLAMQRGNTYNNNYYNPNNNPYSNNYYNQNNNPYDNGYNNPNNYGPNNGGYNNPNNFGPNNGGYNNPNNFGPNNGGYNNPNNFGPNNGGFNNPNNYGPNNGGFNNPNNFGPNNGGYNNPNNFGPNNGGYNNPNNLGPNNGGYNPNNSPYNYTSPNYYGSSNVYDNPSSYNQNNNQSGSDSNPFNSNGTNSSNNAYTNNLNNNNSYNSSNDSSYNSSNDNSNNSNNDSSYNSSNDSSNNSSEND